MIRTLPPQLRARFVALRSDIACLRDALRLNRPLAVVTLRETLHVMLSDLDWMERSTLDALNGVDDCPADLWDDEDLVVLGPAALGRVAP